MSHSKTSLIEQLHDAVSFMRILEENEFKIRAYEKGADAIEASTESLEDIAAGKIKIPGVGEGLKTAVKDFLKAGKITSYDELKARIPEGVVELMKVPGLGPKKAATLAKELSLTSVAELEYACRENRLLTIKGFGEAIQKKILKSIEEMKTYAGKIRIDEALELFESVRTKLLKKEKTAKIIAVGELGRHCEIISKLEILCVGDKKKLEAEVSKLEIGIAHEFHYSAKEPTEKERLNFMLDEKDRQKTDASKISDWEFTWLETEWLGKRKPTEKTYRLKRDGHVKGIFHNHTTLSDGIATLEEMVREAEKLGYEYIGISDHSETAVYANGLKTKVLKEQAAEIKELQKKVSIKIFHGIESDILNDGDLDYDDSVLKSLDFVVGSIHSRFKMDGTEMTKRLVRALENPFITMWGHPTGRLLLGRKGYDLDWDQCLKAMKKNRVAIEINANPQRLDVDWRLGAKLEENGIMVCINPDAHATEGLKDTVYGEYVAEKAMLPKNQILNMMNVNEIEKYLHERKTW